MFEPMSVQPQRNAVWAASHLRAVCRRKTSDASRALVLRRTAPAMSMMNLPFEQVVILRMRPLVPPPVVEMLLCS